MGPVRICQALSMSYREFDAPKITDFEAHADGARHPKKSGGVFREGVAVRYAFVERHRKVWPAAVQCRVLSVSASGYHQYRTRQRRTAGVAQPGRRMSDMALLVHIRAIFAEMKGAYGWPRLWRELHARG